VFFVRSVGSMICTSILRMVIPPLVHNDCNEEARFDVGSVDVIEYSIYYAVEVEFVVTLIHNDCNEEARFDVIRRLAVDLLYAASLSGFVFVVTTVTEVSSIL